MSDCRNDHCVMESQIKRLQEEMKEHRDENRQAHKEFYKRLDGAEKFNARIEEKFERIMECVNSIKQQINENEREKREDWRFYVREIIKYIIVFALGAACLYLFGIK